MKTVFVIGSNSFSGADFIDLVLEKRNYRVFGFSRSPEKSEAFLSYKRSKKLANFRFHQVDINNNMEKIFRLMEKEKPAFVVNFAAQSEVAPSWNTPEQWFQTNAVAVAKLSNFLKGKNWLQKYVHISSPEVYGTCEGVVKEDAPFNPSTPYAASKAAGDMMLKTLVESFSFPMVMVRATNVYGVGQQLFKIIPRSIIYLKMGKTIELHGGGEAIKSYIHIGDVSNGELLVMEQGRPGEIYHLSPDTGIQIRDIVRKICDLMEKDFSRSTKTVGERLGQDAAYIIDSSKIKQKLGWKAEIGLDEGLISTISWINDKWHEIREEPLDYIHKA